MKTIKRKYLQDVVDVMGTPDIKVITGVRRSGKSELLYMFIDYIKENVENSNIIYIDFNLDKFDELKEYKELINYVSSKHEEGKNNFILIDEVQMCNGFEKAINNFHAEKKYDILGMKINKFQNITNDELEAFRRELKDIGCNVEICKL